MILSFNGRYVFRGYICIIFFCFVIRGAVVGDNRQFVQLNCMICIGIIYILYCMACTYCSVMLFLVLLLFTLDKFAFNFQFEKKNYVVFEGQYFFFV